MDEKRLLDLGLFGLAVERLFGARAVEDKKFMRATAAMAAGVAELARRVADLAKEMADAIEDDTADDDEADDEADKGEDKGEVA